MADVNKIGDKELEEMGPLVTPPPVPIKLLGLGAVPDEMSIGAAVSPGAISASNPQLAAPAIQVALSTSVNISNKLHDISMALLDGWLEDIKESGKRQRAELLTGQYRDFEYRHSAAGLAKAEREKDAAIMEAAAMAAYIPHASPTERAAAEKYLATIGVAEGVRGYNSRVAEGDPSALLVLPTVTAASIVVGSDFLGGAITAGTAPIQVGMAATPYEQMNEHYVAMIADDHRAELGLIGAMFSVGIAAQSNAAVNVQAGNPDDPRKAKEFVESYAKNLLMVVKGSDTVTTQELAKFISPLLEAKGADPARLPILTAKLKLGMLATAIAMMYKQGTTKMLGTGAITGQEFLDIASGKIVPKKTDDPLFHSLIAEMRSIIGSDVIPQNELVASLESIGAYLDNNPNMEKMLGSGGLIPAMLMPGEKGELVA